MRGSRPAGREALAGAFGRAAATDAEVIAATRALEACGARAAVSDRLTRLCREAMDVAAALPLAAPAPALLAGAASALAPGGGLHEGPVTGRPPARGARR